MKSPPRVSSASWEDAYRLNDGAVVAQGCQQHVPAIVVVVYEKNLHAFQRDGPGIRCRLRGPGCVVAIGSRRTNVEPRSVPALSAVDGAAVQLDDLAHQRQPQPQPAMPPARRRICLAEPIEHIGQEVAADALSGVADDQVRRRSAPAVTCTSHAAAGLGELHRVRQQVPDDLLQPIGSPLTVGTAPRSTTCDRDLLGGGRRRDDVDRRLTTTRQRRPASISSRSLPLMTRAMSSRSSTSRSCDGRVALDDLERVRRDLIDGCVRRIRVQPSTALSGVRISCDSVARNSSFSSRRFLGHAARAAPDAAIWLRSSRSLTTRSVTSSIERDRADDRVAVRERRDPRALRHLAEAGA